MARLYSEEISFIGVGAFDSTDRLEAFVDHHELRHFPHAISEDGELFVRFELSYHPAWVLVDAGGEVVLRAVRPSPDEMRAALDELASR